MEDFRKRFLVAKSGKPTNSQRGHTVAHAVATIYPMRKICRSHVMKSQPPIIPLVLTNAIDMSSVTALGPTAPRVGKSQVKWDEIAETVLLHEIILAT